MDEYNFKEFERQLQESWDFTVDLQKCDPKKKYYILDMFPYPSGNIHIGHLRNYTISDVIARHKRALGFEVFHPIGWDAFGLPAENAAISNKTSPKNWTERNIFEMRKQLKRLGISYDWSKEIRTCDPSYYKHEQQFFIDFLKNGLVYKKETEVNWDPVDNTVLANEQVIDGRGWRSGAIIQRKRLSQWFLKITEFKEELLSELDNLKGWPDRVKVMQKKWIGKADGAVINFKVVEKDLTIAVFSTHPETIFGASFCAISKDHPVVSDFKDDQEIQAFLKECNRVKVAEEEFSKMEKLGIRIPLNVWHPFQKEVKIPVYVVNFVLMDHATGAIFGCPAHDKNDYEFATKYNLPILPVIETSAIVKGNSTRNSELPNLEFGDETSKIVNSDFLNDKSISDARELVIKKIEEVGIGVRKSVCRLKDWGVSRQRYWGTPIPIIYCAKCGTLPVQSQDLPVTLPEDVEVFSSSNVLASHPTWKYVKCYKCSGDALRETDTFDTFFESSWYFASFCSGGNGIDKDLCSKFLPVDCYVGGMEHAILHLLYARFFVKALSKCGYIDINEPFKVLLTQGMVCHKTYKNQMGAWLSPSEALELQKRGENVILGRLEKMSKSKKNVVDLAEMLESYGADSLRLFILSDNPIDKDMEFSIAALDATYSYIKKIYRLVSRFISAPIDSDGAYDSNSTIHGPGNKGGKLTSDFYQILSNLNQDLEKYRLNVAVSRIHQLTNLLASQYFPAEIVPVFLRVIEPFVPHIAENLWKKFGNLGSILSVKWPENFDDYIDVNKTSKIAVQINGKLKKVIDVELGCGEEELKQLAIDALGSKLIKSEIKKIIVVPLKIVNVVM